MTRAFTGDIVMQLTSFAAARTASSSPSLFTRARLATLLIAASLAGCGDDHYDNHFVFNPYDVPNSVVIADLNGDGLPDLAVAATHIDGTTYPDRGFASVILQNSSAPGTFQRGVDMAVGLDPSTIAVGDLDATGGVDLVVANVNSANVSLLTQSATPGQFNAASNVALPSSGLPFDIAIGDLNNDGLNDLAVADASNAGEVIVLFQDPANHGHYLPAITLTVGNPTTAVAIGDVDGDGLADLLVTSYDNSGNNGRVSLFAQDAVNAGQFLARVDFASGARPTSVKIADLNGDGLPDLLIANRGPGSDHSGSSGVSVLLQTSTPGTFATPVTYATASGAIYAVAGDLNGDGQLDLVVANLGGSSSGSVSVLLQDAAHPGVFFTASNYAGVYGPLSVDIGDLNGDGRPDIAVADGNRATIMFQSTTTAGTFAAPKLVGE